MRLPFTETFRRRTRHKRSFHVSGVKDGDSLLQESRRGSVFSSLNELGTQQANDNLTSHAAMFLCGAFLFGPLPLYEH